MTTKQKQKVKSYFAKSPIVTHHDDHHHQNAYVLGVPTSFIKNKKSEKLVKLRWHSSESVHISFQFDEFFFSFFQTCWDILRLHTSISSFDRFQIFCCCWQFSGLSPWRLDQLKDYWDKGHHKPSLPLCLCRCCRMSTLSPKGVHGLPHSTHISVCN